MRTRTIIAAAALLLGIAGAAAEAQEGYQRQATCTPRTVRFGSQEVPVPNPIAAAIGHAGPGSIITVTEGIYPPLSIGLRSQGLNNARSRGGAPFNPIVVQGQGNVRIEGLNATDAILISQQIPHGHITFKNITILPGWRSGVMFAADGVHAGYRFIDCKILGGWDHVKKSGRPSKWGIHATGLKDFEFRGANMPALVRDLRDEHAFYLHNMRGDALIENVHAFNLGRTFLQLVARSGEGPPGVGTITVRNCVVTDPCIAAGDNYKGGFAFTIGGRHTGTMIFEKNTYRAGFDPHVKTLTATGQPYGTGAFTCIDGGEDVLNGTLILRDNDFQVAPECGDRPLVSVGGCKDVRVEGRNSFIAGAWGIALALDPPADGGAPGQLKSKPNVRITVDPATLIGGRLEWRGKEVSVTQFP